MLHYVTNCLPEWNGQSLYRAAISCYAAPQTFTFILLPSSSGVPFPGHLQWAVQTWSVMWQILRTVGTCHQIPGGTLSVCSFLCTALSLPDLSVCQLPGALLSAVEWSELGTCPVYVLSHVRGYITYPWCCFKVLEAIPQISCGFCLLHCQYATDLAFINFVKKYMEFLQKKPKNKKTKTPKTIVFWYH